MTSTPGNASRTAASTPGRSCRTPRTGSRPAARARRATARHCVDGGRDRVRRIDVVAVADRHREHGRPPARHCTAASNGRSPQSREEPARSRRGPARTRSPKSPVRPVLSSGVGRHLFRDSGSCPHVIEMQYPAAQESTSTAPGLANLGARPALGGPSAGTGGQFLAILFALLVGIVAPAAQPRNRDGRRVDAHDPRPAPTSSTWARRPRRSATSSTRRHGFRPRRERAHPRRLGDQRHQDQGRVPDRRHRRLGLHRHRSGDGRHEKTYKAGPFVVQRLWQSFAILPGSARSASRATRVPMRIRSCCGP